MDILGWYFAVTGGLVLWVPLNDNDVDPEAEEEIRIEEWLAIVFEVRGISRRRVSRTQKGST